MFLYSQDLSNRKTAELEAEKTQAFLYSQDLSNRKTCDQLQKFLVRFCTLKI